MGVQRRPFNSAQLILSCRLARKDLCSGLGVCTRGGPLWAPSFFSSPTKFSKPEIGWDLPILAKIIFLTFDSNFLSGEWDRAMVLRFVTHSKTWTLVLWKPETETLAFVRSCTLPWSSLGKIRSPDDLVSGFRDLNPEVFQGLLPDFNVDDPWYSLLYPPKDEVENSGHQLLSWLNEKNFA